VNKSIRAIAIVTLVELITLVAVLMLVGTTFADHYLAAAVLLVGLASKNYLAMHGSTGGA
jgi:hypothetical protein